MNEYYTESLLEQKEIFKKDKKKRKEELLDYNNIKIEENIEKQKIL